MNPLVGYYAIVMTFSLLIALILSVYDFKKKEALTMNETKSVYIVCWILAWSFIFCCMALKNIPFPF